jgi:prepilin-type N-terminal cleavage/methylation domain-containing protein
MYYKKGFTLLEMVIYIAILAVVSVFVITSILNTMSAYGKYRVSRYINLAGSSAMERITREIRMADDILAVESVFEVHPGKLKLSTIDPVSENTTTVDLFASSTQLMIKEGSDTEVALTPVALELTNLIFREVATSTNTNSYAIKVEMEIKGQKGNIEKTAKFYNTVILRRSY